MQEPLYEVWEPEHFTEKKNKFIAAFVTLEDAKLFNDLICASGRSGDIYNGQERIDY